VLASILEFKALGGLHEKRGDNAALCNRKVNKEKRIYPLYFLSDAGQSAQPGAGASCNAKAGNSDTGIPRAVYGANLDRSRFQPLAEIKCSFVDASTG